MRVLNQGAFITLTIANFLCATPRAFAQIESALVNGYSRNEVLSYQWIPENDASLVNFADGSIAYWNDEQLDSYEQQRSRGRLEFFKNPSRETFSKLSPIVKKELSRWAVKGQMDSLPLAIESEIGTGEVNSATVGLASRVLEPIAEYYNGLSAEDRKTLQEFVLFGSIQTIAYAPSQAAFTEGLNNGARTQLENLTGGSFSKTAAVLCKQVNKFSELKLSSLNAIVLEGLINSSANARNLKDHTCQVNSKSGIDRFKIGERINQLKSDDMTKLRSSGQDTSASSSSPEVSADSRCTVENIKFFFKDLREHFRDVPSPHSHNFRFNEGVCQIQGAIRLSKKGEYELRVQRALPTDPSLEPKQAMSLDQLQEKVMKSWQLSVSTPVAPAPAATVTKPAPAPVSALAVKAQGAPPEPLRTQVTPQPIQPVVSDKETEPGHAMFIPFTSHRRSRTSN